MRRSPDPLPAAPGVYVLLNKRRRIAYFAATGNLQKRAHAMATMLATPGQRGIKALPKHPSEEWTFEMILTGPTGSEADRMVEHEKRNHWAVRRGYTVIGGERSMTPMVTYNGQQMTLLEAVERQPAKRRPKYNTAYRRIQRGWSVLQALGLLPAPQRQRTTGETA